MFKVGDQVECIDTQTANGMIITIGYKGTVTFVAGRHIAVDGLFGHEGRPVMYEGAFKLIEPVTEKSEPVFNPIYCRDRIKEIDSLVERLEEERVSIVQALEDEGFALISALLVNTTPVEDMNDWRNWKKGDLLECVSHKNVWSREQEIGSTYSIICEPDSSYSGDDDLHILLETGYYVNPEDFKFHSRPQ